jgi:hypothetical protein
MNERENREKKVEERGRRRGRERVSVLGGLLMGFLFLVFILSLKVEVISKGEKTKIDVSHTSILKVLLSLPLSLTHLHTNSFLQL